MVDYSRVLVYSQQDEPLFEIAPKDIYSMVLSEELGGEHTLAIETSKTLETSLRILLCDATGKWREFVVYGMNEDHYTRVYIAVWSLQADMSGITCDTMPGTRVSGGVSAHDALESLLTNTNRWGVGTVTCGTYSKASFYGMSGWEALGVLSENWGCEIDSEITVGTHGVLSRNIALLEHVGSQSAVRRFDWSYDLIDIHRKVSEKPLYARIIPLGKGEEITDESGDVSGYGRRLTIESVNDGIKWLQNDSVAESYKLPDGNGGWEYPTRNVVYDGITDALELKNAALEDIDFYTLPYVTYSASVAQFTAAGLDAKGVSLGDEIQCVDSGFGTDGIRLNGRVVRIVTNLLDASDVQLTIGNVTNAMSDYFQKIQKTFSSTQSRIHGIDSSISTLDGRVDTTVEYLANILDNINSEINANGGYTYITDGNGLVTYDTAVSDPKIGAEASKVVEMKGGSIRIANSRTAQGEWDWKSVFISGHIAAELITAANITAGYIGSLTSQNYINLDTGEIKLDVIRQYGDGVLVCRPGNTVGALVTPDGSFDVVSVAWSNGVPTTGALLASFGTTAVLGRSTNCHVAIDYNSIDMVDRNGNPFVELAELRDTDGYATITETYVGDGSTTEFTYSFSRVLIKPTTVKVNGTTIPSGYSISGQVLKFTTAPTSGASITLEYSTNASTAKAYTLGYDRQGNVGGLSFAEGYQTEASGAMSHSSGSGTIARSRNQFVIGRYNVADQGGKYLFIVGNGEKASSRSNAFAIGKDGSISSPSWFLPQSAAVVSSIIDFDSSVVSSGSRIGGLSVFGNVVQVMLGFRLASALQVTADGVVTNTTIGTLKAKYKPLVSVSVVFRAKKSTTSCAVLVGSISTDGSIHIQGATPKDAAYTISTSADFYFSATYIVDQIS